MRLLVTGGSGFIGSAVVREVVRSGGSIVNVDKLTYAATAGATAEVVDSGRYVLEQADIVDTAGMENILRKHRPDRVMHLAAESHVDRSIDNPLEFVRTNVVGTASMLHACTAYYETLHGEQRDGFRFHHVSTDEVFGSLGPEGKFGPNSPYDPRSPYSASKASADHLARAWYHSYGLPVVLSNCSNNYGPYQFPEKLIPMMIARALQGLPLPVYGKGEQIRDWLFVEDHAAALLEIVSRGVVGMTYLIGGDAERRNIDVVHQICTVLDDRMPTNDGSLYADRIAFVQDRPGHDYRYAIDASATAELLGWSPATVFENGLATTVQWYIDNKSWWEPLLGARGAVERVGLARKEGPT